MQGRAGLVGRRHHNLRQRGTASRGGRVRGVGVADTAGQKAEARTTATSGHHEFGIGGGWAGHHQPAGRQTHSKPRLARAAQPFAQAAGVGSSGRQPAFVPYAATSPASPCVTQPNQAPPQQDAPHRALLSGHHPNGTASSWPVHQIWPACSKAGQQGRDGGGCGHWQPWMGEAASTTAFDAIAPGCCCTKRTGRCSNNLVHWQSQCKKLSSSSCAGHTRSHGHVLVRVAHPHTCPGIVFCNGNRARHIASPAQYGPLLRQFWLPRPLPPALPSPPAPGSG